MRSLTDYKDIVSKLLAKASAVGVTAEEKEMLETKAYDLMAQFMIDKATLPTLDGKTEPVHLKFRFTAPYAKQKMTLYNSLAKNFNCRIVRSGDVAHVFGFQSDCDQVDFLYVILLSQAVSFLLNAEIPAYENAKSFKTGWWYGFCGTIHERLSKSVKKATDTAVGSAIMLRDRSIEVEGAMRKDFPHIKSAAKTYITSSSGVTSGRRDGALANLSNTQELNSKRSIT